MTWKFINQNLENQQIYFFVKTAVLFPHPPPLFPLSFHTCSISLYFKLTLAKWNVSITETSTRPSENPKSFRSINRMENNFNARVNWIVNIDVTWTHAYVGIDSRVWYKYYSRYSTTIRGKVSFWQSDNYSGDGCSLSLPHCINIYRTLGQTFRFLNFNGLPV